MITINLIKMELNNFCKSPRLPQFVFLLFMLVVMEFGLNRTGMGITSLGSSGMIFFLILSQPITSKWMGGALNNSLEYFLSRTVTRQEIFKGSMAVALFLCVIIMVAIGPASVMKNRQVNFRVYGFENTEKLRDSGKFTIAPDDMKDFNNKRRTELQELLDEGELDQFKQKDKAYSVSFQSTYGIYYILFLKFFLLLWTVISSSIYINIRAENNPYQLLGQYLREPWGYFKGSGWILMFCFILLPFVSRGGILRGGSSQLTFYLLNFWPIAVAGIISLIGAWFIVKRSYSKAEV